MSLKDATTRAGKFLLGFFTGAVVLQAIKSGSADAGAASELAATPEVEADHSVDPDYVSEAAWLFFLRLRQHGASPDFRSGAAPRVHRA